MRLFGAFALPILATAPALAASGKATDRAFVREMIPHHQTATEMAELAKMDAKHARLRRLARDVIEAQTAEIRTLKRIAKSLGVKPAEMPMNGDMSAQTKRDLKILGLTGEESGMTMDMHALHHAEPSTPATIASRSEHASRVPSPRCSGSPQPRRWCSARRPNRCCASSSTPGCSPLADPTRFRT